MKKAGTFLWVRLFSLGGKSFVFWMPVDICNSLAKTEHAPTFSPICCFLKSFVVFFRPGPQRLLLKKYKMLYQKKASKGA